MRSARESQSHADSREWIRAGKFWSAANAWTRRAGKETEVARDGVPVAIPVIAIGEAIVVVVEAKPDKYTELKRDDVLGGKVWSYPVLAYNHLFARSTTEGVCLEFQ